MSERSSAVRIAKALRDDLSRLEPNARLPTTRELVARHGASPVTVQRALALLRHDGLIYTKPGLGAFVAAPRALVETGDLDWQTVTLGERSEVQEAFGEVFGPTPPEVLPLGSGYLDRSLQPLAGLNAAMSRAVRRPGVWDRVPAEGLEPLRAWFAGELGSAFGPRDVLITAGGQAALTTVFRALARPGDVVLVESPTHLGTLATLRASGARPVPVPADHEGLRPDLLERAFATTGARVVYSQPTYANPTSVSWTPERRAEVLEVAARAGAFVVEDDAARDLSLEGSTPLPLVALDPTRVVYIRSLTKSTSPGLRVAGIAARGPVHARLRETRVTEDLFVAGPLQETALEWVTSSARGKHLKLLRETLRIRRDVAVAELKKHRELGRLTCVPSGGLHLWVALPETLDDVVFALQAREGGVHVNAGRPWFATEAPRPFMRLTYAAANQQMLQEAIEKLASFVC